MKTRTTVPGAWVLIEIPNLVLRFPGNFYFDTITIAHSWGPPNLPRVSYAVGGIKLRGRSRRDHDRG